MKALIFFNHPAPYKVKLFNALAKEIELFVVFERKSASDRPKEFYTENTYDFEHQFIEKGAFSKENSFSFIPKRYIKANRNKFDLIIMNGYSTISEQLAINYMIRKHIPYILFVNGGVIREKENFIKKKLKMRYIKNAAGFLSPNEQTNKYLEFYGAKNKIFNYPYSTYYEKDIKSPNLSEEERTLLRNNFNLPEGKLLISASNFIPRKNNFEMFDAVKGEDCSLVLYGNGPLKEKYDEYLKENNITNVIIRNFVKSNELMNIMSCCDAFITLSNEDIYGHTTMEALASGIPVISSEKVVSSVAVIENRKNGFLVKNKENVKNAIKNIDYSSMSSYCIDIAKKFSIEKEAQEIVKGLEGFKR